MTNCTCCGTPLSGSIDTYGDVGGEMCWTCWGALQDETMESLREQNQPGECAVCGKVSAYEKGEAGYPGLYHCTDCGAWFDKTTNTAWRFDHTKEGE